MSARVAARLAWSLCALCVALAAASLILALLNGRTLGEIFISEGLVTFAIWTVSFSVVGALISSHAPWRSPTGSGSVLARAVDLGAGGWPDPGVPATAVPRRSPAFASLAPGGLARQPLHRPDCRVVHDTALAREGSSTSDRR